MLLFQLLQYELIGELSLAVRKELITQLQCLESQCGVSIEFANEVRAHLRRKQQFLGEELSRKQAILKLNDKLADVISWKVRTSILVGTGLNLRKYYPRLSCNHMDWAWTLYVYIDITWILLAFLPRSCEQTLLSGCPPGRENLKNMEKSGSFREFRGNLSNTAFIGVFLSEIICLQLSSHFSCQQVGCFRHVCPNFLYEIICLQLTKLPFFINNFFFKARKPWVLTRFARSHLESLSTIITNFSSVSSVQGVNYNKKKKLGEKSQGKIGWMNGSWKVREFDRIRPLGTLNLSPGSVGWICHRKLHFLCSVCHVVQSYTYKINFAICKFHVAQCLSAICKVRK